MYNTTLILNTETQPPSQFLGEARSPWGKFEMQTLCLIYGLPSVSQSVQALCELGLLPYSHSFRQLLSHHPSPVLLRQCSYRPGWARIQWGWWTTSDSTSYVLGLQESATMLEDIFQWNFSLDLSYTGLNGAPWVYVSPLPLPPHLRNTYLRYVCMHACICV